MRTTTTMKSRRSGQDLREVTKPPTRRKQTSSKISSLAARVIQGYQPTRSEVMSMAYSLVSQDETPPKPAPRKAVVKAVHRPRM